jgi:D-glycero-D-manno-heptose 1,7-bisphosphate phosphatase
MQLLLLDLDGTIRRSTIGEFINDPSDQEPIEGAIESLKSAQKQGWAMIGITNQAGVAAGHKTLESAILEQKKTLEIFPMLSCIYFCPDFKGQKCFCLERVCCVEIDKMYPELIGQFRKPNPGMIFASLRAFDENPTDILMVGDRKEDEFAAKNAGLRFLGASEFRNLSLILP